MAVKKLFLLFSVIAFVAGCSSEKTKQGNNKSSDTETSKPQHIQQASFTTFSGNTVSVADFKGKVVLIDFWETWCNPCTESFPTMQKLQDEYPQKLKILTVTPGFTDTKEDAQGFAKKHDYDLTYLIDSNNLHQKIGVEAIPYKIFIDTNGDFIKKKVGSYGPKQDYKNIKEVITQHYTRPEK